MQSVLICTLQHLHWLCFTVEEAQTVLVQARNVKTDATINDSPESVGMRKSNSTFIIVVATSGGVDFSLTTYHAIAVTSPAQAMAKVARSPTIAVNLVLVAPSPK